MIVEHLARATWESRVASSRPLPETGALARRSEVRLATVDQRAYGADAKKAATLLIARLPDLAALARRSPRRGQRARPGGHLVALGRMQGAAESCAARFRSAERSSASSRQTPSSPIGSHCWRVWTPPRSPRSGSCHAVPHMVTARARSVPQKGRASPEAPWPLRTRPRDGGDLTGAAPRCSLTAC